MVLSLARGSVSVEFLDTESQWWQEMYQPGFLPRGIKLSELKHDKGPNIVHCVSTKHRDTQWVNREQALCRQCQARSFPETLIKYTLLHLQQMGYILINSSLLKLL